MLEKKEFEIPSEKFKKGATVYTDSDTPVKAAIIYFHGGGLLYGRRKDLPRPHLNTLTQAGYAIIAFDYPLAPAAKLEMIMNDVESSIQYYIDHSDELIKNPKSSEGSLPVPSTAATPYVLVAPCSSPSIVVQKFSAGTGVPMVSL